MINQRGLGAVLKNAFSQAMPDVTISDDAAAKVATAIHRQGYMLQVVPMERPAPSDDEALKLVAMDNAQRLDRLEARFNNLDFVQKMRDKGLIL